MVGDELRGRSSSSNAVSNVVILLLRKQFRRANKIMLGLCDCQFEFEISLSRWSCLFFVYKLHYTAYSSLIFSIILTEFGFSRY